ncbi:MAG: hypothetical protein IJ662_11315 [Clostridia bacterium]|nr:hypothetical protein [Clostridia bacterium]
MQEYLQESRFRPFMDGLGLRCLIVIMCTSWFVLLWGVTPPALLSGLALATLILLLRRKTRDGRLKRREQRLRQRIGGEMALERLLLSPPRRAHFEMAVLLTQRCPLTLLRAGDAGILCQVRGDQVLLRFCQKPATASVHGEDVLALQQAAKAQGAARGVLCAPCGISPSAHSQAQGEVPVSFLTRDTLIALFGQANPVTDQQLVALGRRRRQQRPSRWLPVILARQRAARYLSYGALLLGMHLLTGLMYYAVPGLICVCLAAACRCARPNEAVL